MKIELVALIILSLLLPFIASCQKASKTITGKCVNPKFEKRINQLIDHSVPIITVDQLEKNIESYLILDAREKEEYDVSHIPGAKYIGYDNFQLSAISNIKKDMTIVVYCSIGYRSEKIGEKLKKAGYTNVKNLFGSIFEWVNQKNEVVDKNNTVVRKVHTYNWLWSKWVDKTKIERVW